MPSLGQGCAHGGLQAQPSPAPRLHAAHQLRMTPTKLLYCVAGVGKSKAYVVAHENDVTFELPPPETKLCWTRPPAMPALSSLPPRQSGHRTKSKTRALWTLTETGGPPLPRTPSS